MIKTSVLIDGITLTKDQIDRAVAFLALPQLVAGDIVQYGTRVGILISDASDSDVVRVMASTGLFDMWKVSLLTKLTSLSELESPSAAVRG